MVAVLKPVNPPRRDGLDRLAPGLRPVGRPRLERLLGAARGHVQEAGRPGAFTDRGQVDDDGHVLVAGAGVAPGVLVDADDLNAVEPARVVDEDPLALGQHGVIGGVPRHRQTLSDAGDGQVLAHDPLQRPPQTAAREPRPRLGGLAHVLAPHVPAPGAAVATDRDQQCGRPPAERLVCQQPTHRVPCSALTAAAATPLVGLNDTAGEHGLVRFEPLASHHQSKFVEAAEGGQVSAVEPSIWGRHSGSVRHVEVFPVEGVGTSILGRP